MSTSSIAYNTSLNYTFPIYDGTMEVIPNIPKDILLSQTLRLPRAPIVTSPIKSKTPIFKTFNNNVCRKDPLADILYESRQAMEKFLNNVNNTSQVPHETIEKPISMNNKETRLNIINDQSTKKTTPITNKTIFFSPSGKGKRSSTPISKDLQQLLRRKSSKNLKQKLLKMDQASLISMGRPPISTLPNDMNIYNDGHQEIADESDYDHLACHADNIMRMAVDSTMLGSTFNSSFSSSFSNSFSADMQGKDFFDKEAKNIILEGLNF